MRTTGRIAPTGGWSPGAGTLADQRDGGIRMTMMLTQDELASLTGASRATVTRALSNWRQRGIIRTSQRDITITDLGALRKIAGQQP
jgi:CRP-like cAMP-binding protein